MAIGTFTVTVAEDVIDGPPPPSAAITVTPNVDAIRDPDADLIHVAQAPGNNGAKALPATLTLYSDVTTGTSALYGYTVTVRATGAKPYTVSFAARPIGSTISLADLPNDLVPVDPSDLTDASLAARASDPSSALSTTLAATYTGKPTTDLGDWTLLRRDTSKTNGVAWTTPQASIAKALGWAIVGDPQYGTFVYDNTTDCAPAIQSAIDSLKGRGGTVWIPAPPSGVTAGTYAMIGSTITVWPRIRVLGTSSLGTRLKAKTGIGGPVFSCTATDGTDPNWHWGEVGHLNIDGNKTGQTAPAAVTPTSVVTTGTSVSATVTTSAAHGLKPGDAVEFSGFTPDMYNGVNFVFSVTDSTHFVINCAGSPATATVVGTYRKLLTGITVSQAGETSWIHNVQVQNAFDHGIIQGWIGTPMRYSGISVNAAGREGMSLWTDRPVLIEGLSGDGNGTALLGVHGKSSAGANAVGAVTVFGIKAENTTVPAVIIDDYAQCVSFVGGGITMGTGNTAPCIQRTSKSQNSSLNVQGVAFTPQWAGSGNVFQDLSPNAFSINSPNSSATSLNFVVPNIANGFGVIRLTQRRHTLNDAASVVINSAAGGLFELTATAGVGATRTFAAPTAPPGGAPNAQEITIRIFNNTGGAITTSWNAAFLLAGAWVDPATGKSRLIKFIFNGTSWFEVSRSAADVG